ncbi:MAG: HTTM domain-containing protein [Acidobacteria bacterium]|nr:HTTM domain-containing protein [Acidobacteriota bacterium]MDA1235823.1 HTTM domain-containing protein [Acidobacteriota bacterium]
MSPRLEEFLFAPANARSVAALRIGLAAVAAFAFYPYDTGALATLVQAPWLVHLYRDVIQTKTYWLLTMAALAAFAAGLWSRPAGLLAALLLAPYVPIQGVMISRYLLWFAVTALSLLCSDRRWALRSLIGFPQRNDVGPTWPIRLIQLQLSTLYLVNAIAKSSPGYLSGGALAAMSTRLPNFLVQCADGLFTLAGISIPLGIAAAATVAIEYCLAIGFWFPRLRWPTAVLGAVFHAGLTRLITIAALDIASVALYAAFLLPVRSPRARVASNVASR